MPDYVKEAKKAKKEGDFSKAGDLFYLAGDDKSAMEMYLKGSHYSLAAKLLEKREDWKGAAKYYVQAGKFGEAAELYANRIRDFRTASVMFHSHGDLARSSEMAEKSGDMNRAAGLAEQAELWERAATLYVQAQKYDKAAEIFYRLLKQLLEEKAEKAYLESFMNRLVKIGNAAGTLYLRSKNHEMAAKCFEAADNLAKAAESYVALNQPERAADLYFKLQEYESAYELMKPLGENSQNQDLFGEICLSMRRYDEAGDSFLLAGKNVKAAEAYEAGENYSKAAMIYEGLEEYPHAAELYLRLKETRKAADLYEKGKNYQLAGQLFEQVGAHEKAIESYTLAGEKLNASRLLVTAGHPQKAVSLLQEIQAESDDYPDACILLGQLFTEMGMFSVAIQKFSEAIGDQPILKENLDLYYALAVTYEKASQYSKSRDIYEKILSLQLNYRDVIQRLQRIKNSNLLDGAIAMTSSSIKRVLVGRYELTEKIGRDPFGVLYRATDTSLGRKVMVRRYPEQDPNFTKNIVDQARIAAALNHPNILAVLDTGKDETHNFICMEYVEGGKTLRQHLSQGKVDVSDICEFASQICLALGYAHKKGVIHKNLTPENIYIGTGNQLKIANFGIEGKYEKGSTLVSKQYLGPEQLMGQKIDARTDLYALGVILYEMLYGVPPFSGQDVELQHLKKVPSFPENSGLPAPIFLVKIIQRCLQKDRTQRYPNSEEILEELEIADIVPGMLLNHRYEIVKELGTGGMGRVYQARDRDLDELVALKVLRAEVSTDPTIQKRFVREIKVARMITHPNVVKVFDIGKYKGNRYISMEFIEGINLDDWLKKNSRADLRTLLTILVKIIQGVHAAHAQKIIHRDLKPQNVILDRSMNPRVLDFGIARSKDHVEATTGGQVLGSPKYMSPEQIQGKDLDKRSDIYSLGVLMFYMFTGEEPFGGDDPRTVIMKHLTQPVPEIKKINPTIPDWLEKVISKALEKDRNHRYSSLKEVLDDLKKGYETQRT